MSELTNKFKNTAVYVGRDDYERALRAMFALGFKFEATAKYDKREVKDIFKGYPSGMNNKYIFVNEDCRLSYGTASYYPSLGLVPEAYVTVEELESAAIEHKAAKKLAKKESKHRNSNVDSEGFSKWTGGKRPVSAETVVQIKFNDSGRWGVNTDGWPAGNLRWDWEYSGTGGDIHGYKVIRKAPKVVKANTRPVEQQEWILNTTGREPTVEGPYEVMFNSGHTTNMQAPWNWALTLRNDSYGIKAYRVTPSKSKSNVVTQQEMVADIVESAGGVEIDPQVITLEELNIEIQQAMFDYPPTVQQEDDSLPETNPKKQFGDKAIPLNLWPALASAYGALGLYNGKLKYGMSNFNATPVEASIYIAGAMRHLAAWAEGEEFDPADGVPNLGGVLANIAIILEARAAGTIVDDRKLGTGYLKEREALKKIVASLQVLHSDKNPRHYTIQDTK
jgi:hypothetical protein